MSYPSPPNSKGEVKRAGKNVANGVAQDADYHLIDQWRASHGYVINTFQAWLKGHISKQEYNVEFAQRLKRRNTVIDKLLRKRPDGTPLIQDVTAMHDFAGCRMIFENVSDLNHFRNYIRSSDVLRNIEHELRSDELKYNYIESPKNTGYRGIHDVFRHFPRQHRRTPDFKRPWDGLMVEIQFRTRAQHAWATAVEISDILDGARTKFAVTETKRSRFFSIASEIIARRHENLERAWLGRTTPELQAELQLLENDLGIMQRLKPLRQFEDEQNLKVHNVLNIVRQEDGTLKLEVSTFRSAPEAIKAASELESDETSLNAVYVRAENPNQLRSAYRNYFNDPVDFVRLLEDEADLNAANNHE